MGEKKHRDTAKIRERRNMSQIKEQGKTPEKELNKMEASDLPDAAFKTLIIKMCNERRGRMNCLSKNLNKEIGNI